MMRRVAPALLLALGLIPLAQAQPITQLEFLGAVSLPSGLQMDGGPVGGLSGLTYYAAGGLYFAVCDDRSEKAPARVYNLTIDLQDGSLDAGDVDVTGVLYLREENGDRFSSFSIDAEGIAFSPDGRLFISSEGFADNQVDPFVRPFSPDGSSQRPLPLDRRYRPRRDQASGIRHNLGFEALTVSPDGKTLWTATENALLQDGPAADVNVPSPSRLMRYDLERGRWDGEFLYWVEALTQAPTPANGIKVGGLVELLALQDGSLLALERSYVEGVGHGAHLYRIDLGDADDLRSRFRLEDLPRIRPVRKELLFDFSALGIAIDNLEGMTFGPTLADGRRSLILVSDDNFNDLQRSQFLAFAVDSRPVTIYEAQGRGHRSPLAGRYLLDLAGIVTAVDGGAETRGFWVQHPRGDGDDATSDALFVVPPVVSSAVQPGDSVIVNGQVEEIGRPGELTSTQLRAIHVQVLSRGNPLPAPVVLGRSGRPVPQAHEDDDGLARFEPQDDAIDFFESLEGMRVETRQALVVGPSTPFGLVVLPDGGADSEPRSLRGGLVLAEEDGNPERLLLETRLFPQTVSLKVGDQFTAAISGVVDYSRGQYKIVPTQPLPPANAAAYGEDLTALKGDGEHLTVATYNVLNLSGASPAADFEKRARSIVQALASPDILALQEIQDNDGPKDDGIVDAQGTLGKLITAIEAAGGPTYSARQIDPGNNADGGQPGGNIRVAYLFNPQRVIFVDRGRGGADDGVAIEVAQDGPRLSLSPGRVFPTAPAFAGAESLGYERNRKSLAVEVFFQGHRIFLVNNHLKSKRGDDATFGLRQPPVRGTEAQRSAQTDLLRTLVDQILSVQVMANLVVLGDMNEHEFRPPMQKLTESRPGKFSLTNLVELWISQPDRYTYNYLGNSQTLDHILISPNLVVNGQPEIDIVHINSDYPESAAASDHDPIVLRLHLPPTG